MNTDLGIARNKKKTLKQQTQTPISNPRAFTAQQGISLGKNVCIQHRHCDERNPDKKKTDKKN